jgi:hypothetical protein
MTLQIYLTSDDSRLDEINITTDEGERILETLGPEEEGFAIKFQELFEAINSEISSSISTESKLTVELTGSMSLKARGGVQYLFFNAGAEVGSAGTMKVTLTSTLKPVS